MHKCSVKLVGRKLPHAGCLFHPVDSKYEPWLVINDWLGGNTLYLFIEGIHLCQKEKILWATYGVFWYLKWFYVLRFYLNIAYVSQYLFKLFCTLYASLFQEHISFQEMFLSPVHWMNLSQIGKMKGYALWNCIS